MLPNRSTPTGRAAACAARTRRSPIALAAALTLSVALPAYAQTAQTAQDAKKASAATETTLPAATVVARGDSAPERTSGGALGDRKIVDTPFSVVAVSSEEIQDRMAQTANDVFKYDPSVSVLGDNARTENSYFAVRGIRVDMRDGIKVDGQNFVSWDTDLPLEPFDQVELLKGVSGFMYGFGTPGGIINYVTKRGTPTPFAAVTVGWQANNVWSEKIDIGGRAGGSGGADAPFGYRFNFVNEAGNTSEPNVHLRRHVLSAAFDARLTSDLTWTADAMYWDRKTSGTIFGLSFDSSLTVPSAKSVSRTIAQPYSAHETSTRTFGTGLDYRINDDWKASVKYRFAREDRLNYDSFLFVADQAGNFYDTNYRWKTAFYYQAVDAMVQGKFYTGGIKHNIVAGAGWQAQTFESDNGIGGQTGIFLGMNNLYNPVLLPEQPGVGTQYQPFKQNTISQKSIFLSDTVEFTDRFSALVGVRYNFFRQENWNPDGSSQPGYSANPITPTVALMYKTDPFSTLYASYVQGLEPGASVTAPYTNAGTTFGPMRSKQYEIGFKTDRDAWGTSVALFRVDKGYQYTDAEGNYRQDGIQRFTGLDTSAWARVARGLRVRGGVLWLHTKTVDVQDPTVDGKHVYAAPDYIVSGYVEYDTPFLQGLTLTAGAKVTGSMYVNSTNTQYVPSYTTADLGARYSFRVAGKETTVRAAINNVFDKRYWSTTFDGFVLPTAGRTYLVNATVQF